MLLNFPSQHRRRVKQKTTPAPAPPATAPVPTLAEFFAADAATVVTFDQPLAAPGAWVAGTFQTYIPPDVLNMTGISLVAPNQVRITTTPTGLETSDQQLNYSASLHTIKGINGLNAASFFGFPVEIV